MGASLTSAGSSVVPTSGEVVSRVIKLPSTFTVSVLAPGVRVILTVDIFAISTTAVVSTFLKPCASAATEYLPGSSPITVNVPAEEVTAIDTTPVARLVIVILAPGTTAWLESVTVPLMPL